jgi:hypothetical protein
MTMETPLQRLIAKLSGVSGGTDGRFMARCPAHDDQHASLSITEADDGKVLLKCHAGCEVEAIVAALGLTMHELFPTNRNGSTQATKRKPAGKAYATRKEALAALDQMLAKDGGERAGKWYYRRDGEIVAMVLRYDLPTPPNEKTIKTFRPIAKHDDGWRIADPPGPWPLYGDTRSADRVYLVEGERKADLLIELGLAAVASAHGAKAAGKTDWKPLAGRDVVILPDNDDPGRSYAQTVAGILLGLKPPAAAKIVDLDFNGRNDHDDILEFLAHHRGRGRSDQKIRRRIERAADLAPVVDAQSLQAAAEQDGDVENAGDEGKESQAQQLVRLSSEAKVELFHDANQDAYASVPVKDHVETYRLRSRPFHLWLRRQFHEANDKPPGAQAIQDALNALEAKAIFDGDEHLIWVRVAEKGGKIFLDLCNEIWQAVEVDTEGWRVVARPPVKFRRAKAMLPLPVPTPGGSVDELRPFLNVKKRERVLILAWLVASLRPSGPYPALCLHGEQGSAKSTTARVLRSLVDPNAAPVRAGPREVRDLAIAASNSWVVALDNLSYLPDWMSDALCRLSTGGGFSTRTLYENDEETIFDGQRPIILNGIEEVATRGDLLDRALLITCPTIAETSRRAETDIWREFEQARPRILGALLDAVSAGLRSLPTTKLDALPRMADFALWASACETALGVRSGKFIAAYLANTKGANELALDSSIIAAPLRRFAEKLQGEWEDSASQLLQELTRLVDEQTARSKEWPRRPNALSGRLRRLAPNLRKIGIDVVFGKRRQGTRIRGYIRIRQVAEKIGNTSATNRPQIGNIGNSDAEKRRENPRKAQSVAAVAAVADECPVGSGTIPPNGDGTTSPEIGRNGKTGQKGAERKKPENHRQHRQHRQHNQNANPPSGPLTSLNGCYEREV